MIIIKLSGQLGNQMFQYSLYRKLIQLGKEVKLDFQYFDTFPNHFSLDIFPIKLEFSTKTEIASLKDERREIYYKLKRLLFGNNKLIYSEVGSSTLSYQKDILSKNNIYLDGYWQTEKYFRDIRSILLNEFVFPQNCFLKNLELLSLIEGTITISIHVRRGDYVGTTKFPLVPKYYYEKAINYFEQSSTKKLFIVFSDDIPWAKENISAKNIIFVDWNSDTEPFQDMYLMSRCTHNIIANSSFSWWGTWLNTNPDKQVIAPPFWFNHRKTPDVLCEGWRIL